MLVCLLRNFAERDWIFLSYFVFFFFISLFTIHWPFSREHKAAGSQFWVLRECFRLSRLFIFGLIVKEAECLGLSCLRRLVWIVSACFTVSASVDFLFLCVGVIFSVGRDWDWRVRVGARWRKRVQYLDCYPALYGIFRLACFMLRMVTIDW